VYVVVNGSGHSRIGDTQVPVRVGSVIRIDPETPRCPLAGQDGMSFISVRARWGSYEPQGPSDQRLLTGPPALLPTVRVEEGCYFNRLRAASTVGALFLV
jgi:hypothetical protein